MRRKEKENKELASETSDRLQTVHSPTGSPLIYCGVRLNENKYDHTPRNMKYLENSICIWWWCIW